MKRKWLLTLLIPLPVLFILFIAARLTGVLQIYRCPTPSGEPTIKVGQIFFTSNLKAPKAGNLIAFKSSSYSDSILMQGTVGKTYFSRLVATGGDDVQMIEGVCFVNGKSFDADKNLKHNYKAGKEVLTHLPEIDEMEIKGDLIALNETTFAVFLTTKEAATLTKKGIKIDKIIFKSDGINMGAFAWIKKDSAWTIDNFGPLKVPKDCFFVMGDNRHNALDSRFVGFIKKENYNGSILGIN